MTVAHIPVWDKQKRLIGFKHAAIDKEGTASADPALWKTISMLSADLAPIRGKFALQCFEFGLPMWQEAQSMLSSHPDSFKALCQHLRDQKIAASSPHELNMAQNPASIELALAFSSFGVDFLLGNFALDKHCASIAARSSGIFLNASKTDVPLCLNIGLKVLTAGKTAIIEGVDHDPLLLKLAQNGAGPFCGQALMSAGEFHGKIEQSQTTMLVALSACFSDSDLNDIDNIVKRDPVVAYKLISLVNSAALRKNRQGASTTREALMLIGRAHLGSWLASLLLDNSKNKNKQDPYLSSPRWVALHRAKLAESLCLCTSSAQEAPQAFVVGAFSALDALLGQPLVEILSECKLPRIMELAIQSRQGMLGELLDLAIGTEKEPCDLNLLSRLCKLGLTPADFSSAQSRSFQWASAQI